MHDGAMKSGTGPPAQKMDWARCTAKLLLCAKVLSYEVAQLPVLLYAFRIIVAADV